MYSYEAAMAQDIRDYIDNEGYILPLNAEALEDELWACDAVTGNASGSYTFCRATARDNVLDNMDLLEEACTEFCVDAGTSARKFLADDWEYFDVTIRCYLLRPMIDKVLEEFENGEDW